MLRGGRLPRWLRRCEACRKRQTADGVGDGRGLGVRCARDHRPVALVVVRNRESGRRDGDPRSAPRRRRRDRPGPSPRSADSAASFTFGRRVGRGGAQEVTIGERLRATGARRGSRPEDLASRNAIPSSTSGNVRSTSTPSRASRGASRMRSAIGPAPVPSTSAGACLREDRCSRPSLPRGAAAVHRRRGSRLLLP